MATIELAGGDVNLAASVERALAVAGASASSLDFVIVITGADSAPDSQALAPGAVRRVIEHMGIDDLPAFRLTAGWAGARQGFYTARALLDGGLGRGLVIGPDGASVVDTGDRTPLATRHLRETTESTGANGACAAYAPVGLPGSGGERR